MITIAPGRVGQSNRGKVSVGARQTSDTVLFPAPTNGLTTNYDVTTPLPGAASVMTNWYPTLTGARIRGGSQKVGTIGSDPIVSSFAYRFGSVEKIFMSSATAIYNVTSPPTPPTAVTADVSGLTPGGEWTVTQHTTAGGSFLTACDGVNTPRIYNGTSWGLKNITFPTGDSTTSAALNFVWLYKGFEFYIKNASLDAYYLPINAVSGEAALFPLGGVMRKGGSLLMGFSWSIESGDGLADMCCFVSSEGEVAVYQGDNPSDINTFGLVGLYQIGKPVGKNAAIRAGGDLLIATVEGLQPLSQVFRRDRQAVQLVSASRPIEEEWRLASTATGHGWTLTPWTTKNLLLITFPENAVLANTVFVMHVLTGRWSIFTGWRPTCFATLQGSIFFGDAEGNVWQGDVTGADDGQAFQAAYLSQFQLNPKLGMRKQATLAHMYFRAREKPSPLIFARADGNRSTPNYQVASVGDEEAALWDVGLWDVAKWDGGTELNSYDFRQDVRAVGDTLALGCIIVSAGTVSLNVEVREAVMQVAGGEASA